MDLLITSKPGYEAILAAELALYNLNAIKSRSGWVFIESAHKEKSNPQNYLFELCFAQTILKDPVEIDAKSANALVSELTDFFMASIKERRIDFEWPYFFGSADREKLYQRTKTVETAWLKSIGKKLSRVSKLLRRKVPYRPEFSEGFFVYLIDFNRAIVSLSAFSLGQKRMQMDPESPSRSYLKIEEAYRIIGLQPHKNEKVVDLGAAPGGWSYSALKRGAQVTAVDNGRLREPVKSHPNIIHLKEDALKFTPGKSFDWLFCDMIGNPDFILDMLNKWLKNSWCLRFVVNLKIGRSDPISLLKKIKDLKRGLILQCSLLKIRHLYHDREEITLVGKHISQI